MHWFRSGNWFCYFPWLNSWFALFSGLWYQFSHNELPLRGHAQTQAYRLHRAIYGGKKASVLFTSSNAVTVITNSYEKPSIKIFCCFIIHPLTNLSRVMSSFPILMLLGHRQGDQWAKIISKHKRASSSYRISEAVHLNSRLHQKMAECFNKELFSAPLYRFARSCSFDAEQFSCHCLKDFVLF